MKVCPNCGKSTNDITSKFCSNCGLQFESENESSNQALAQRKVKKKTSKVIIIFAVLAIVAVIAVMTLNNTTAMHPVLQECIEPLGMSHEYVMSNDDYDSSSILGITLAEKNTDDLFGIDGKIVIFLLEEEEIINIVTWQSKENITLTDSEIDTFVDGMKKSYGKPTSTEDGSYMWNTDELGISLKINNDEVYILLTKGTD